MNRNILLVGQDFDRSILNKLGGCQLSQKNDLFIYLFVYLFIYFAKGTQCQRDTSYFTTKP